MKCTSAAGRIVRRLSMAVLIALLPAGVTLAQADDEGNGGEFAEGFGSFADDSPSLEWGGELLFATRVTADYEDPGDSMVSAQPELRLDLDYRNENSEVAARLEFRPEYLAGAETAVAFAEELVDEAFLTLFYDRLNVRAGYLKEVWGTGDQAHVVDVLNSNDFRDFVNPDYIDRRIARPMIKLTVPVRAQGRFGLACVPVFRPDLIPQEGAWAPAEAARFTALVEGNIPPDPTYSQLLAAQNAVVEPDTNTLQWGQYAARYRDTFGPVDLGLVYYHGFLKQPSVRIDTTVVPDAPSELTLEERFDLGDRILLDYDRVNVFGLEYAAVLAGLNTRAEAAYYLTPDLEGDDPAVTNNSIRYLAGFDWDLPVSNLTINVQGVGSSILGSDEIDANYEERMEYDFQYDENGDYTNHIVSASVSDSYAGGTIRPRIAVSYGIEKEDWYILPSIELSLPDDVKLITEAAIFAGDEGYFAQYDDNDYLEIRFEYSF